MPNLLEKCCIVVAGNTKLAGGLQTYLLSRDLANLKSQFQRGNGKVCVISQTIYASVIVNELCMFWFNYRINGIFYSVHAITSFCR